MKQFGEEYIETIKNLKIVKEHSQLPYSKSSLFLMGRSVDLSQLRLIEEATLKKQPVTVITSMDMKNKVKNDLLHLMTEYENNSYNPDFWLYRVVKIIGNVIIGLGFLAVFVYTYFYYTNNPIIQDSSIILLFVPLLITYGGFLLVDFIDRQLLKRFKLRPNLELIILKPKHFKVNESILVMDDTIGYMESKNMLSEFEMDEATVNRLAKFIVGARQMDKRNRIVKDKTVLWLMDD